MAEKQRRERAAESESEIWNAISAFEKILEVMPEDRSSLETLAHAYEHIGDRVRALEYLLRLGEIIASEGDPESTGHIIEGLRNFGNADPRVAILIGKLESQCALSVGKTEVPDQPVPSPVTKRMSFRVADELSFAWKLFESGEINQDEYAAIAHDLAELAGDAHLSTVSVLHVLESRAFSGMERVMDFVSRDTKTPVVSLLSFEIQEHAAVLLPYEFTVRRGALVFDMLKDEALVAVMNPYDRLLREDVKTLTGKPCHFFMTQPREYDAAVAALARD